MFSIRTTMRGSGLVFAVLCAEAVCAADWPQWGGSDCRAMVSTETGLPDSFTPRKISAGDSPIDSATDDNLKWTARLGSAAYGNPTGMNFPGTADVGVGLVSSGINPAGGAADTARNITGTGVGITLGSLTNAVDLDLLLMASEFENETRTISNPRILTLDNQSASITQGDSIPFSTTSAAGTKTEFVDAALKIDVTPHVTSDGRIIMDVTVSQNEASIIGGKTGISKNEAKTQILVKDGETVVIGGIYKDREEDTVTRIPGLGKLTFIGWMFRETASTKGRDELLIFLTPRVISGGEQYLRAVQQTGAGQ